MIRLIKHVLLIPVLLYTLAASAQDLEFYREDICFNLNKSFVETVADYNFCNVSSTDMKKYLFYPFPAGTMKLIDSLKVSDLRSNTEIFFSRSDSGIFFPVHVKAYEQSGYRVHYHQQLEKDRFIYILTSTITWGKPLEFANYELRAPAAISIDSFSFPPDTSYYLEDVQYFFWKKVSFMPEKDFEVSFHSGK